MKAAKKSLLAYFIAVVALWSCSSGKSAFEHGNYYEAVLTSVNRLRKNDDHEKSAETLRQAYPMAIAFYEDRAKASLASNAEFKWSVVVESYTIINVMYDEIRRSPGALKVIPNPLNYYSKLEDAKKNAAEENYAAGILAMTAATREKAKVAYGLFIKANGYVPGYKDVIKMTETALWNATVKVVMEPIPVQARNISVSAEFFDNKVSEYLHTGSLNQFVKFYTRKEAETLKLNPDHIIKIEFDEFAIGQVFMNEKEIKLEKDSILVGNYVSNQPTPSQGAGAVGGASVTNTGSKGNQSGSGNPSTGSSSGSQTNSGTTGNQPNTGTGSAGNQSNAGNNTGNTTGNTSNTSGNTNSNNTGNTSSNTSQGNNSGNSGQSQGNENNSQGNSAGNSSQTQDTVKVTVCHIPPGNPAARHTLVISRSALKAHLAHGDSEGACADEKDKGKPKDEKKPTDKKTGKGQASSKQPVFYASTNPFGWLSYQEEDTVKIYTTVKATLFQYQKTTTSKGVISFKIIDAKTNGILSVEKMPGEYTWISEWATFNGDERALSREQLRLTRLKEQVPPQPQDMFIEFTKPIYDQLTTKIRDFYKNY